MKIGMNHTPVRHLVPVTPWLLCLLLMVSGCAGISGLADKGSAQPELARLTSDAERVRDTIREHLAHSQDGELKESLRVLDTILDYAERVKTDPTQFDPEKIDDYSQKIRIIHGNIERFKDPAFQVSISFPAGTYRIGALPEAQKETLQALAGIVARTIADLRRQHPSRPLRVTLKSIGYTDENPILAGTRLAAAARDEIDDLAPAGPERRRQYNQILSRLRATNANQFVIGQIRSSLASGMQAEFVQKITGMGERLPLPDVSPPYRPIDSRRRISLVKALVEIVL